MLTDCGHAPTLFTQGVLWDVHLPERSAPGVDELVRHTGRYDYDLAAGRLDRGVAYREGSVALLYHEDLLVGMLVQPRATTRRAVHQEERNVHIAVEVSLELVRDRAAREFVLGDYAGHHLLP